MKKILWFSNCILSNKNNKASGSWLYSMAKLLLDTNDIYLVNITVDRTRKDDKINQLSDFNFEEFIFIQLLKFAKRTAGKENPCEL